MKFGIDFHGPQRMNPNDFGDVLTFPVILPGGQILYLSSEMSQYLLDGLAQHCEIIFSLHTVSAQCWLNKVPMNETFFNFLVFMTVPFLHFNDNNRYCCNENLEWIIKITTDHCLRWNSTVETQVFFFLERIAEWLEKYNGHHTEQQADKRSVCRQPPKYREYTHSCVHLGKEKWSSVTEIAVLPLFATKVTKRIWV